MLTKLKISKLKCFDDVEIDLSNPVVFVGPNNSGKTTALQALALWEIGIKKWLERRGDKPAPQKRAGVTINRLELIALPVNAAKLLWHDLRVRDVKRNEESKQITKNVLMNIIVEGITNNKAWECGLEFYYANDQSFYCRPIIKNDKREIPPEARGVRVAFLPPMSGLAADEKRLDMGAINVRIGEGRTAEVLRNLCYSTLYPNANPNNEATEEWNKLVDHMKDLFGITLMKPIYVETRGEITMSYKEVDTGIELALASAGRGAQQTLLLLSYMSANPGAVILIDEPDAHLETLRQRQIYQTICDIAGEQDNQVIIATHSEVVLNEAASKDKVVAFIGKPHVMLEGKSSEVRKALTTIGFEQYNLAIQMGWVLYLEGSTDLDILRAFAKKLNHDVYPYIERPFTKYVTDKPGEARKHFFALKEAVPELKGIALFDSLDHDINTTEDLKFLMWERNEIENYFCFPEILLRYARRQQESAPIFTLNRKKQMEEILRSRIPPAAYDDLEDDWWKQTKITDQFLDIVFEKYSNETGEPILRKGQYFRLIDYMEQGEILPEVKEKLDEIYEIARSVEKRKNEN